MNQRASTRHQPSRLAKLLLAKVLLFSMTMTLVLTLIQGWIDYRERIDRVHASMENISNLYTKGIVAALWNLDKNVLAAQVEGMLNMRYLNYVAVIEEGRTTIEAGAKKDQRMIDREIPLAFEHLGKQVPLGVLYVQADATEAVGEVIDKIVRILLIQGASVVATALFLFLLVNRLVTRYLSSLATQLAAPVTGIDQISAPLRLDKKAEGDEIDVLLDSFNLMRENLATAHLQISRSRDRLSELYNETPIMMQSVDRTGTLIDCNDHWLKVLGYQRQETIGRKITDFLTPESRKYAEEVVLPAFFRDGSCKDISYQLVKKNGELLDVLLSATGERDAAGNVIRSRTVIEDVTERKRAEEALRESENRFRTLFEQSPEGVLLLDTEGGIVEFNSAAHQMLGYSREEFAGLHIWDINIDDVDKIKACIVKLMKEGRCDFEALYKAKNGEIRNVRVISHVINLGGRQLFHSIWQDVTERHLLEAEQLKSQKLEAIGTLAGGIAHDFNNLLQGVFGYISMAKLSLDSPGKALAMLDQVEKALSMSVSLTTQLLTFAKGGKPAIKQCDPRPVIENATKFALSGSQSVSRLNIPDTLWPVLADEGQISQVIQNIVLNASQAMPDGGVVELSAENIVVPGGELSFQASGGRFVKISIRDSGVGIPEHYRSKIFDPYFTTKPTGSGLGLATCYSIIKNHGGGIDVAANPDQGTTFSIYLPATEEAGPAARGAETSTSGRKCKILVMDDDEMIRTVARSMISALGHEVESAADGEEAVEKYREAFEAKTPFAIIILDLTVKGGMGGEEAIRQIRELDPEVVAVVSSGYADNPVVADYTAHGFTAFLNKPYTMNLLRECLNSLLA